MAGKDISVSVVIKGGRTRTYSFELTKRAGIILLSLMVVSAGAGLFSLIYSSYLARKTVSYVTLKEQAKTQSRQINDFFAQTEQMMKKLEEVSEKENRIRRALGLKASPEKMTLLKPPSEPSGKDARRNIFAVRKNLDMSSKSLDSLLSYVQGLKIKFTTIPSIWPVYGQVMSRFGYRHIPWSGFHSGIDIDASYGAPVRVAAEGRVLLSGWKTGYGRTVIVAHGSGMSTLYGHLSRYAVSQGEKVKKGQVIGYVGATGYATGSHLHYEVLRDGVPVDPKNYLDLNILKVN